MDSSTEHLDPYSGTTSRQETWAPKTPTTQTTRGPSDSSKEPPVDVPWYNPRGMSLHTRLIVGAVIVAVVVVATVVGTIEGIRANRYPDYSALNYTLVDTYEGTSFFDRFHYFSDQDPTDGFVK